MSFRLRNSNSRMARTILIDCEGLESEKKKHARPLEIHEVWGCTLPWRWRLFSHSSVGRKKIVSETGLHMAIKLQLRTLRRNVVRRHRKVGRGPRGGRFTFRKSEHQARHSQLLTGSAAGPLAWSEIDPAHRAFDARGPTKPTSKGLIVLGKDASVGWFVSGYVRLLQSQYESKSARTVLKIISQNLADYF